MPGTIFLSPEQVQALERSVEAELVRRATAQGIKDPIVRDLLPSDINGVSGEIWVEWVSAASYNTVFSGKLTDPDRLVAIYGMGDGFFTNVSAASAKSGGAAIPTAHAIKFGLGAGPAKIKDIWNVAKIRTCPDRPEAFAKSPIIYNKDEKYTIQVRGDGAASAVDHIVLYGKICEARGETIT